MSKLKIKARGISMEVVGKDDLIQREREAFLEYAENHKGIQIGVTAIPVERLRPFPEHMNCKCSCDSEEPATETEDKQEGSIDYIRTVKRHHKMNWQELAEKIKKGIIPVEVGATVSCELTDGTPAEFVVTDVTDQYVRFETRNFIGGEVEWNEQDTNIGNSARQARKSLQGVRDPRHRHRRRRIGQFRAPQRHHGGGKETGMAHLPARIQIHDRQRRDDRPGRILPLHERQYRNPGHRPRGTARGARTDRRTDSGTITEIQTVPTLHTIFLRAPGIQNLQKAPLSPHRAAFRENLKPIETSAQGETYEKPNRQTIRHDRRARRTERKEKI